MKTIGLTLLFAVFAANLTWATDYRTVALTGDAAPGTAGTFDSFQTPSLNSSNDTSFVATAQGGTPGLWAEGTGGLNLVALAGSTAPGIGGSVQFSFFDSPVRGSTGGSAFVGFVTGSGVTLNNNSGIWSNASGSLSLLARAGSAAPGTAGGGGGGGGTAGTLSVSASQPTVDFDNLDEEDAVGGKADTIRPLQRTSGQNRVLGQSFTPDATRMLHSIVLLADTAESFDGGTHELQLAVFEDNIAGGNPGGDTLLGSIETFNLANVSWGSNSFLTLNLNTPVEITGGQEHHFEFWFTTEDNSHNINFDRSENGGSVAATDGILVVSQINASDPAPTFPVGDNMVVDGGGGERDLDYGFIYSAFSGVAENFAVLGSPVINQQGRTAFFATLSGGDVVQGTDDNGIWAQDSTGAVQLVVRAGQQAPGTTTGTVFSLLSSSPAFSADGRITFQSTLAGPDITQSNASGIWTQDTGGNIQLVARAGNSAPGTTANFGMIAGAPSVNSLGNIAFTAGLTGGGVTTANNRGIWSNGSGTLSLVVRENDAATDAGTGVTFGDLETSNPIIGDNNEIAFRASLAGTGVTTANNASLWEASGGTLSLVAREGEVAPGVSDGATFLRFENDVLVNANGQTAFVAALTGSGVTSANNLGIWAEDSSGLLTLVARTGELLDVDNTAGLDERTITELSLLSSASSLGGPSPAFDTTGMLAFFAAFDDSTSGIFIADVDALVVPSGDFNADGDVDGLDFLVWQRDLGTPATLTQWQTNYGTTASTLATSASVPEPTGLMLTVLLLGNVISLRWRTHMPRSCR